MGDGLWPPPELSAYRDDPDGRLVLYDWCLEHGLNPPSAVGYGYGGGGCGYAGDGADADGDDGCGYDGADADGDDGYNLAQEGIIEMNDGLKLIQLRGYNWAVTKVGWLRRSPRAIDWWELHMSRTIVLVGLRVTLGKWAKEGPLGSRLLDSDEVVEDVHVSNIGRCLRADETSWLEHVPRPVGWP